LDCSFIKEEEGEGEGEKKKKKQEDDDNNNRFLGKLSIPNTEHRWNGN